jgi:CHAT domain-containing protein
VDDLATALLMARFYEFHLDQGLTPAAALRQAQIWLRTATTAELVAFVKTTGEKSKLDTSRLGLLEDALKSGRRSRGLFWDNLQSLASNMQQKFQTHPFAHPIYWAGFFYTGL